MARAQGEDVIVAAFARNNDGVGELGAIDVERSRLRELGARVLELTIDPLSVGWDTPIATHSYRTGAAPAFAVRDACASITAGQYDAVVITGHDPLRSDYDSAARRAAMDIYRGISIPEAYTRLAERYMRRRGWTRKRFLGLADELWGNYCATADGLGLSSAADRLEFLTPLFRYVDCANPVVDFEGQLVLVAERFATARPQVRVVGVGTAEADHDGPDFVDHLARFVEMRAAFRQALGEGGEARLRRDLEEHRASLELYTCFPIVPLAALLETGLVEEAELEKFLATTPVTITGGMNLAKGAWSCAALNGLIAMCERVAARPMPHRGLVHFNGGLGYRQGCVVLSNEA